MLPSPAIRLLLRRFALLLAVYTILRLGFYCLNLVTFRGIGAGPVALAFVHGLRFDVAALLWLNLLLVLLSLLVPVESWRGQQWLRGLFVLLNLPGFLLNIIDWEYFKFIGRRLSSELPASIAGHVARLRRVEGPSELPPLRRGSAVLRLKFARHPQTDGFLIVVEAGAKIGNRVVIEGPCWIGKNTRVINGAIVRKNVMIGANTRVSDYCLVGSDTVIGNNCVVGHGAEFDGVMLDGAYIYHYSEIYGVLGAAVDIGAATVCGTLRFDDAETIHKIGGRREFPKNGANAAYFGDYCRTGVNVITQPGVKIGAYSCVGAGIVLYDDVPSRKLRILKQDVVERDWGPERYGW